MTVPEIAFRDRLRQLLPQSALYAALLQEPFFSIVADVAEGIRRGDYWPSVDKTRKPKEKPGGKTT